MPDGKQQKIHGPGPTGNNEGERNRKGGKKKQKASNPRRKFASSSGLDHWLEANATWHRHLADVPSPFVWKRQQPFHPSDEIHLPAAFLSITGISFPKTVFLRVLRFSV
jgi:hypothetical protein